jgi:trimeric autotransporter adhesin
VSATGSASTGAGCSLPAGGAASWSCSSDRNLKESIKSISPQNVLSKVLALPVTSWQFIGTNRRHIGPMAQDFRSAFGLGADDKNITTSDVSGVALAAIQGLNQKLEAEKAKNKAKAAEIAALKADLALIKKKLGL